MPLRLSRPVAVVHLIAAAVGLLAFSTAEATANAYTVRPCTVGVPPFAGASMFFADGDTTLNNQCTSGGGLRMTFAGGAVQGGVGNGFRVMIPAKFPNARIRLISGNITIAQHSGTDGQFFTIDETNGGYNPNGQPQLTFGAGGQIGPRDFMQSPTAPTRSVIWRLSASSGATSYDAAALGAHFVMNGMNVDIDDPTQPLAPTFAYSGLLDGSPQTGIRTFSLAARDQDSGVHEAIVLSDTTQLAQLGPETDCTYVSVQACPGERSGDLPIDTTRLPNGPQQLTIVTNDAAGNTRVAKSPVFTVANAAAPPSPPASPPANGDPKGSAIVTASLKATKPQKRPALITTSWRRPVTLRGRVLAADGAPMPGVAVDISQVIKVKGATSVPVASVTTDAKGVYRYPFKATSSATIAVQYPNHVGAGDYSAAAATKLSVRANVTMKRRDHGGAARRGLKMRFSGRVDAAPFPPDGVRVAIQYHLAKGGWLNADVVTTNGAGVFTWKHSFRTAGAFRLRARVLSDPQLPAAPGSSPELRFRIR